MGGNFHPGFESLSLRHFKVLRSIWASWDWPFFLVVLEWACRELSWAGKKVSWNRQRSSRYNSAMVPLWSLDGCHALGFGDGQEGGWVILDCGYEILISRRHTPTCADILAWSDLTGQIFHSIRKNQINSCLFSLYIWRFRKKSENSQFSIFALNNFNRLWGRNSRILTFYEIVIFEYRLQIWEDQNGIPVSQPRIQTRLPWGVSNRFCFDFLFWHARSVLIYSHRYCCLTLKLQNLMFRFVNI